VFGAWQVGLLCDEVVAAPEPRVVAWNVVGDVLGQGARQVRGFDFSSREVAVCASVLTLVILAFLDPCKSNPAEIDAPVSVIVYSCLIDYTQPPQVRYRAEPHGWPANETVANTKAASLAPGVWRLSALLPRGHWYVRLASEHCAASLTTDSVDGEEREYLTGTIPRDAGPLYELKGYLNVVLPYDGDVEDMWLSLDCSPGDNTKVPVRSGRHFYFAGVWPGDYCFVYQIAAGVTLSKRVHIPRQGTTIWITSKEVKEPLEKPFKRMSPTATPPGP
jgi:hypothetical protein